MSPSFHKEVGVCLYENYLHPLMPHQLHSKLVKCKSVYMTSLIHHILDFHFFLERVLKDWIVSQTDHDTDPRAIFFNLSYLSKQLSNFVSTVTSIARYFKKDSLI